jgi:hypothetical protein
LYDYISKSLNKINEVADEYGIRVHLSFCSVGDTDGNLLMLYGPEWSSFLVFRAADDVGYEENVRMLLDGVLEDLDTFRRQIQAIAKNPRMRQVEDYQRYKEAA